MQVPGPEITLANAAELAAAGAAQLAAGDAAFDFAAVERVDSAGLAVILEWQRAARHAGRTLELHRLPANLIELADLYGLAGLISENPQP